MKRALRHLQRPAPGVAAGSLLIVAGLLGSLLFGAASGAQLGHRSLTLSDNRASTNTTWQAAFTTVTNGPLGSVELEFCSNDPFPDDPCTPPAGLDTSSVVLSDQTGVIGFSLDATTDANHIFLTRTPGAAAPTAVTFTFDNAKNPSSPGSYFMRIQTFASSDASGASSDYGGLAFAITNSLSVSAEVPPYLIFCVAVVIGNLNCANSLGSQVDFGELSMTQANTGSSQMLAATNALYGYAITYGGTTMASGTNAISEISSSDVSRPSTSQFGINLVANGSPSVGSTPNGPGVGQPMANYSQANFFRFDSGETLVTKPNPDNVRVYTVSYVVNVPKSQSPGIYASTITYVCLANF